MRWVRNKPTSVVKHCFNPPSWLGWTKLTGKTGLKQISMISYIERDLDQVWKLI